MAWTTPPNFTAGNVVTEAQLDILSDDLTFLKSGVAASTTVTANVGPTSGTTELVVATAPSVTTDGSTLVEVSFNWFNVTLTVGTDSFRVYLYDGATAGSGTQLAGAWLLNSATNGGSGHVRALVTPSAAAHTFTARLVRAIGTGTATLSASSTLAATIVVRQVN